MVGVRIHQNGELLALRLEAIENVAVLISRLRAVRTAVESETRRLELLQVRARIEAGRAWSSKAASSPYERGEPQK
jgi:hypothetical protein